MDIKGDPSGRYWVLTLKFSMCFYLITQLKLDTWQIQHCPELSHVTAMNCLHSPECYVIQSKDTSSWIPPFDDYAVSLSVRYFSSSESHTSSFILLSRCQYSTIALSWHMIFLCHCKDYGVQAQLSNWNYCKPQRKKKNIWMDEAKSKLSSLQSFDGQCVVPINVIIVCVCMFRTIKFPDWLVA